MSKLTSGRNVDLKLNKRVICSKEKLFEVLAEAEIEKIPFYSLIYAYDGKEYMIGYGYDNNINKYLFGEVKENSQPIEYNSLEEMKNNLLLEHEITILYDTLTFVPGEPINCDIKDNYILKEFVVDESSQNYNMNLSEELISKYENMKQAAAKENKKLYLLLGLCVVFIIAVIILAAVLGS